MTSDERIAQHINLADTAAASRSRWTSVTSLLLIIMAVLLIAAASAAAGAWSL
jgi:hypothetical protein